MTDHPLPVVSRNRSGASRLDDRVQSVYNDFLVQDADNVLVCSDWEFPDTDPEMLTRLLLTGITHNIRKLVIAGDTLAFDLSSFNTWAEMLAQSGEDNFEDQYGGLVKILKALSKWFTQIHIINGNHDERIQRATGGQLGLGMLLKYSNPNVKISYYRYMYLKTSRKPYLVTHPRNYSVISLGLAQRLSDNDPGPNRDGERVGVIVAHTHHGSMGVTKDGTVEVIGLGCMRDPCKTKYKAMGDATNPEWNQGRSPGKGFNCLST